MDDEDDDLQAYIFTLYPSRPEKVQGRTNIAYAEFCGTDFTAMSKTAGMVLSGRPSLVSSFST